MCSKDSFLQYCGGLALLLQPQPNASSGNVDGAILAVWIESPGIGAWHGGFETRSESDHLYYNQNGIEPLLSCLAG